MVILPSRCIKRLRGIVSTEAALKEPLAAELLLTASECVRRSTQPTLSYHAALIELCDLASQSAWQAICLTIINKQIIR